MKMLGIALALVAGTFCVADAAVIAEKPKVNWVNVGSNSGRMGFDWQLAGTNGLNLAGCPQGTRRDFPKVKAHRAEIADGAYVIIPLCPFTSVVPPSYNNRPSADRNPLEDFDGEKSEKEHVAFRDMLDRCWKGEFSIVDYADPMSEKNRASYKLNVGVMRGFIDWCKQEKLRPVLVLPPAEKSFDTLFPESFMKAYILDFVKDLERPDVPFINYWKDPDFRSNRLWATSLFLNKTGRKAFTQRVMKDVTNVVLGAPVLAASTCRSAVPASQLTEAKTWTDANGKTFRYRWHAPAKIEADKRYPLVVLMHGAGERGTNNVAQLVHGATDLLNYAVASGNDCFFLAGQVPAGQQWVNVPWSQLDHRLPEEPSETMGLQMAFLEKLFVEQPIDRDRVYATGISMGGYGTWDLVSRKPEWFAAAMPVCGGGDVRQAWKFKNVPVWTHHGDKDNVVPFARSRRMTAALWDLGCPIKYTEHLNVGHGVWGPAYANKKNLEWLFAQKRKTVERVPFATGDRIAFLGDSITQFGVECPTGYVHLVMNGLAAQGVKAELVPAGVSGNMSNHMRARLQKDVLDKQPKWMFLSCGVNDTPNGYEDERKNPGHPLKDYVADISYIVQTAKKAGIGVIMLEPTPVVEEPHLANVNEKAYVEAFRKIAAQEKCPIVPLNAVFHSVIAAKENPFVLELTCDGTHMAYAGNRLMADVILRTLGW